MSDGFDGIVPQPGRPRTRGARRRAPPTEDVFRTASMTTPKKAKRSTQPSVHTESTVFPMLGRSMVPTTEASTSSPFSWPFASSLIPEQREDPQTSNVLVQRLHAKGIQRSHAQVKTLPNVSPFVSNNQAELVSRGQPPRSVSIEMNDSKPLVHPRHALHPASDGVLIPTRPVTSSSLAKPPHMSLRSGRDRSDEEAVPAQAIKKVPMTARDKFYVDQRAMTAPSYGVGQSPRRAHPKPPSRDVVRQPLLAEPRVQATGGPHADVPRRSEILSGSANFKTFTETVAEDLRRMSAVERRTKNEASPNEPTLDGSAAVAPDSFLYLRRVDSNPYHLAVTSHTKIHPDNYYTVSRLGITHFAHNSSEFIPLEKFERENYIYSLMVKLPFFRKYRLWKRFTLWKRGVNNRKRTSATLALNQTLFVLLPHLHEALMQLRRLCVNLNRVRLFDFEGASGAEANSHQSKIPDGSLAQNAPQPRTYTLGEFSIRLKAQKMDCERQVDQFIAEASIIAKNACEQYLYAFLQETGFNEAHQTTQIGASTTAKDAKTRGMESKTNAKPKTATEALERAHEMSYTERATMRTQCRKITKFLRVVEFLISDALLRVAISSTERLHVEMTKIKDGVVPLSTSGSAQSASQAAVNAAILARFKHAPLFRVEVGLLQRNATQSSGSTAIPPMLSSTAGQLPSRARLGMRRQSSIAAIVTAPPSSTTEWLHYSPQQEHLRSQIEALIFAGLKIVTTRERLLANGMFKVYLDTGADDGVDGGDGDDDGGNENGELSNEGMDLDILIMEDVVFVDSMQNVHGVVQEAYTRADTSCKSLLPFLTMYHENIGFCARVSEPSFVFTVEIDELRDLLEKYTKQIEQFNSLPEIVQCGLLLLDNARLNGQIKPSPKQCLDQLHRVIPLVIEHKNSKLMHDLTQYNDRVSAIPTSVDEYAETLAFLRQLQSQMDAVEAEYSVLKSLYGLIEEFNVKISDMDHTNAFLLSQRRAQLRTSMDLFDNSCETYTEKFGVELESRVPGLVSQLTQLISALSHNKLFQLDSDPQEMVEYLGGVEYQIQDLEEAVKRHSFFEKTLALPHTNAFEELDEVQKDLMLKVELWNGMLVWNGLTKEWDPLRFPVQVDVTAITEEVMVFYARILQWEIHLSPGTGPLCAHLKSKVESYRVTMPILHDLKCPSFEDRHHKELQALLGFSIRQAETVERRVPLTMSIGSGSLAKQQEAASVASSSLTLGELVLMHLAPFAHQVNRIAADAIQERLLKESLDKIIAVWEKMEFEVRAYKDSKDYCVLIGTESVHSTLEESLVNLTSLLNSKYLAPIKEAANTWQRRLALFQETLDAWIECQRKWMHLETIFSAPDIQKQLPNESMMFITVNQFWKDLMRKARDQRNCMKVSGALPHVAGTVANLLSTSAVPGLMNAATGIVATNVHAGQVSLLETLNRHNTSLDRIEKSLEDYLETKRGFFPRFYFISNDELLEMLAHAKEPQSVQRHLCKCFDALVKLDISEDGASNATGGTSSSSSSSASAHDILAMISPEGERVAFSRSLKARGNVEDWLNTVLSNMRVTLQRHMKACVMDYQHTSREAWLFRHPAQCVAVVTYIMWARECEVCFNSASNDPLRELAIWHQTICSQLSNLTRLVRTSLTKVQRSLVVSLVTTDVHFRDVVEDLIAKKVTSSSDFIWAQQLRYYWGSETDECYAQQANVKIKYGYEYMGACSRLVITPLTDRCWMTITGALALSFGAAPSGPAGTGKTETSKDLAKALGTLCIVFNCSDQIDYKMMAKIFNGAFQSGSWTCLDEFNRIDIEVLSVVAQQMTTIRHARLCGATDVMFEGKAVPMREHHIIITMNPGYVGRTELPDNLKVCFRPVAMMVPDYALIAEILLFAEGFQEAKPLSKKITKLYKLCSEQLSQQPHYDFGMRAVKSVLLIAGTLKRTQLGGSQDESITLLQAMEDANIPKFVDDDIVLFHGILRDLFPDELVVGTGGTKILNDHDHGAAGPGHNGAALVEEIDRQISSQGYSSTPKWKQKIVQLFETLEVRVGVVQTGTSGSGKSIAFRILKDSLTALRETRNHPDKRFQKVVSYVLNPKSIAMNELYGFFHPMTREWIDGLASSILRQCITEKSEAMATKSSSSSDRAGVQSDGSGPFYWITFDGPIDVLWIESMNTVLDDNMTLCLANGERIKLLPKIQLLFEVTDTSSASPATISRLGVVYHHSSYLGWQPLVEAWLNGFMLPTFTYPPVPPASGGSHSPSKDSSWSTAQFASAIPTGVSSRLNARLRARLVQCCELFVEPGLHFLRSTSRAAVPVANITYVSSLCSIFETVVLRRGTTELFALLHAQAQASSSATTASVASATAALENHQNRCIDLAFVFSFVWSFGGNLFIDKWKAEFQELVFQLLEANETFFSRDLLSVSGKIASRVSQVNDNFFDFYVSFQHASFVPWECLSSELAAEQGLAASSALASANGIAPPLEFNPRMPLFQLIVPTNDMNKYSFMTKLIALEGMQPVYLTGLTGAGKTVLVQHVLRSGGHSGNGKSDAAAVSLKTKILPIAISFSAQTSSLVTQLTIESKLVKKRKTLLGAPPNVKGVIFIDDVNMPKVEPHGAQPPIELLRQYLEYRGIYDRDKFFWKEICDCVLIAAGGLPGGGRHALCSRFMRQFSAILCMPSSDESAMKSIFNSILSAHVAALGGAISKTIKEAIVSIIDATVLLYESVSKTLLPTPSKSYYLFNLRDVTKLMQGVVLGLRSCGLEGLSLDALSKLWAHECIRVFRDRLMDEADKKWFSEQLVALANRHVGLSWTLEHVFESSQRAAHRGSSVALGGLSNATRASVQAVMLFAPRSTRGEERVTDNHIYEQVHDLAEFERQLNETMVEYIHEQAASSPPQLVFFSEAVIYIAAITRILIQPRGHALLLGMAGSGKRSLARMACFLMDYHCFEIELTKNYSLSDFREMLKTTMVASVLGKRDRHGGGSSRGIDSASIRPTVLLLNESQLIAEQFVEDINALLNGGEIPKLFPMDEYEKMLSDIRSLLTMQRLVQSDKTQQAAADEISRADCEAHFHTQIQRAMHIIICHSPVSDTFRTRIRQFPSLVNCTTIVHFDAWPSHALQYVADRFLTRDPTTASGDSEAGTRPTSSDLPTGTRQAVAVLCMETHQAVLEAAREFLHRFKRHVYFTPKHFVDLIAMFVRVYRAKQAELEAKLTRLSVGVIKLEETNALVSTLQEELVALQPILQSKTVEAEQLLHQVGIDQREASVVASRVAQDEARVKQQQQEVAACQADAQKDLDMALPALNAAVHALDSLDKKDITEVKAFIKPPLAVQVVMEAVCIMLGEKADWDTSKRVLSRVTFMSELKEYDKDAINPAILKRIRKYIENPDFAVDEVKKVSRAAMSLCMWVHAIDTYARVYKDVAPKRQRLAEMNGVLAEANARLAAKQNELAQVMGKVQVLKNQCDTTLAEKQRLMQESELTQARLQRAERLTVGLEDERVRWKESIELLRVEGKAMLGNAFMAAAAISYLGPFNGAFRTSIMHQWTTASSRLVEVSPGFSLIDSYGDAMELREWELLGLPSDVVSRENAIFVMNGNPDRWPFLIDPQQQATQWIQRLEAANHIENVKAKDRSLLQVVERTMGEGVPLLIEGVDESSLEQALEPLLMKAFLPSAGSDRSIMQVKLGDRLLPVHVAKFRLYLVTHIPNPHFLPDVFIRTNVINFTVTKEGLTEQLLGDVVRRERVEIEERKHNLLYSITQDQKMLQQIEIKILSMLSESKGNILDDVELIQALESAKHTSRVVTVRLQESEVTKLQLLQIRSQYEPVAVRGAMLFFVVAELTALDAMYQYSLEYFRRLFILSLDGARPSSELLERLENLTAHLMLVVYRNIARGLFEAHKLVFSSLICFRLNILDGHIQRDDMYLLDSAVITAGSSASATTSSTEVDAIEALLSLASYATAFAHVLDSYRTEPSAWTEWLTSVDPYTTALPDGVEGILSAFQQLVLVRWMRDDAWTTALRHYVYETLGDVSFVDAATSETRSPMAAIYSDMDKLTPCLFILSSGADPVSLLTQFAREISGVYPDKYRMISLGQGQGPIAERHLDECTAQGHWLILQNIHLAKSWIPRLEELLTTLAKPEKGIDVHDDFRLFLTSFPVSYFPIVILQNTVKVTNEPPKGIKANLQRSMGLLETAGLETATGDGESDSDDGEASRWMLQIERQLVFGLSFFHAVIQERTKFGALGWNLKYDFSDADFSSVVSLQRLLLRDLLIERPRREARRNGDDEDGGEEEEEGDQFADEGDDADGLTVHDVPWDALHFLTGEIYYGGRVTDEFDRRCLMANLQRFCAVATVAGTARGGPAQPLFEVHDSSFSSPLFQSHHEMAAFVDSLPPTMDAPFVFGMHPNANVFYLKRETQRIVAQVLQLQTMYQEEEAESLEDDEDEDEDKVENSEASVPKLTRRESQAERRRDTAAHRNSAIGGGLDNKPELVALQVSKDIQQKVPRPSQGDVDTEEQGSSGELPDPFTVVLQQELAKCNTLLATVHDGLQDLQRAIQGHIAMSSQLDAVLQSLWQHRVPLEWRKLDGASATTATSTQSLALWVAQVRFRTEFLLQWEATGSAPHGIFPLSVFCFPQGFFTAILQRHARKYVVAIHHLEFQFIVLRESFLTSRKHLLRRHHSTRIQSITDADATAEAAKAATLFDAMDGAFISGLFLEGAQWSDELQCLVEPKPGVMHHAMPVIHVVPQVAAPPVAQAVVSHKRVSKKGSTTGLALASRTKAMTPSYLTLRSASSAALDLDPPSSSSPSAPLPSARSSAITSAPVVITHKYVCPLYKTRARKGTLSTTGISTNFVLAIELACEKPPDHYALNGTALISNLAM